MKINVNDEGLMRLEEIFEPIELVSTNGQSLFICCRDGVFEIGLDKSPDETERKVIKLLAIQEHDAQMG